jgi:DNA repair photolyase
VKINAPEILKREIEKLKTKIRNTKKRPIILFGSITDPYHGYESKYKVTRKCLEIISKSKIKAEISILTKSPLVIRDLDILKNLDVVIGLTITTTDDKVSKLFEVNAPISSVRLSALKVINKAGIKTYVCINPLLPHFITKEKQLRRLLTKIQEAGTNEIWLEHLNLSGKKMEKMKKRLSSIDEKLIPYFETSQTETYKEDLNKLIYKILKDFSFNIGGGGIIDHKNKKIIVEKISTKNLLKKGWKAVVLKENNIY